ncbi:MAG: GC-type dockerin domain-anchored protein [Planctomycetota bacterium]|nr:GC-type dockerin domain-anchored protein [Planctomycetota bacterium]
MTHKATPPTRPGFHAGAIGLGFLAALTIAPAAFGQLTIDWYTIDGGGVINASGGTFTLSATIGQPDASAFRDGGSFSLGSGFWAPFETFCPADFNRDGQVDFFDYLDFAAAFSIEDSSADFNDDGQVDFFDYLDFAAAFDSGC